MMDTVYDAYKDMSYNTFDKSVRAECQIGTINRIAKDILNSYACYGCTIEQILNKFLSELKEGGFIQGYKVWTDEGSISFTYVELNLEGWANWRIETPLNSKGLSRDNVFVKGSFLDKYCTFVELFCRLFNDKVKCFGYVEVPYEAFILLRRELMNINFYNRVIYI